MESVARLSLILALWSTLPAGAADPPQLDPKYGEGCWVSFFSQPGFEQPLGRLAGALYINSIAGPGLIAYAEPGFRKAVFALEPQREVKDLRKLGFPKAVASLKIACEYR